MALVNSAFSVNVTPGAMPPIVHVSEYDTGRTYTVTINGENGGAFVIPTGASATIEGTLNGEIGFSTTATIANNAVSFTLTESMTAKSGKAWCKIKLSLNDEPIQTCAFVLDVDRAGVEAETVIGADGFDTQIQNAVDNYLDEHPVDVEVDPTLTISGAAADAKVVGDRFAAFVTVQESLNLYNGEYLYGFRSGSSGAVTENANFVYTKPITLDAGDYLFPSSEDQMGSSNGRKVWIVDANGNVLSSIGGTVVGTKTQTGKYNNRNIIHFTMPSNGYVSMNIGGEYSATGTVNQVNNFMVVQGSTIADFPDYEAYSETEVSLKDDIQLTSAMVAQVEEIVGEQPEAVVVDATLTISGAAADAKVVGDKFSEFITTEQSANLYNGTFESGYRAYTEGTVMPSNTYIHSAPIALSAGGYLFPSAEAQFGAVNGRMAWVVDENGNVLSSISGTVVGAKTQTDKYANRNIVYFTMPSDGYVSMNIGVESAAGQTVNQVNNFMVVRGDSIADFPDYVPYSAGELVPKQTIGLTKKMASQVNGLAGLIGKTAIFDGDSICAGTSVGDSEPTRGYGWAGRIGIANEMKWKNFGVDGGVITSASNASVSDKHSVCDNVDTMYAQYPNADFVIFEGGTNDADKAVTIGDVAENDFSGTYDATTFCGALNTIFYKATSYWKGKAIGYIVAHKMGRGANNRTTRATYFAAAKSVCAKWGIPVLDLWDGCYLNPDNPNMWNQSLTKEQNIAQGYLYTDGQHLTAKGYDYISPIIEDWMKGI